MPTIDQLQPAVVASDDDVMFVSQGGSARRVTRGQLLAGTQSALSLTPGLLGRGSPGLGSPEKIAIGGGLRLADGVLSSPSPYSIAALPATSVAVPSDIIPICQGGQDRAIPISTMLSTPGIDVSNQIARAALGKARKLCDWLGDELTVEAFGAVGDGITDDSLAFTRAVSSGSPVRLGAKTYRVDGQWSISASTTLIGIPGVTTLRRRSQSGGAWISVSGAKFTAVGVIFDAGQIAAESWGVLVTSTCTETRFEGCSFTNAMGQSLGTGLTIQARDGLTGSGSRHTVRNCTFENNSVHGLWIQAACGAVVEGCSASQNGAYGICLDYNDTRYQQRVRNSSIIGCRAWQNQRGISVGNYNETNSEPPRWGLANPDACDVAVLNNTCFDNLTYGIAAAGDRLTVSNNQVVLSGQVRGSSGILVNASHSTIANNSICGAGQYGIDAGGCVDCDIAGNTIQSFDIGINAGGGQRVLVTCNRLYQNLRAITALQVETDGNGENFGLPCEDLIIDGNVIAIRDSDGGGIYLINGPRAVSVIANTFFASVQADPARALFANTDSVVVRSNSWNGLSSTIAATTSVGTNTTITVPDIFDEATVLPASSTIMRIICNYQAAVSDQITFIRIVNGGSGYNRATITILGNGAGAQGSIYLRDGVIIGAALSSGGSGYGGFPATVSISGDGQGATAIASVGLPVINGKRLCLQSEAPMRFGREGSIPLQVNWIGTDFTVPAGSDVVWIGTSGRWRAASGVSADYVSPRSDGSVSVSSFGGELSLHPGPGRYLRVCTDAEPVGFLSCFGRGSPEGRVIAPPGSDYRNLDGGIGTTLWLKRSGLNGSGWAPIA